MCSGVCDSISVCVCVCSVYVSHVLVIHSIEADIYVLAGV